MQVSAQDDKYYAKTEFRANNQAVLDVPAVTDVDEVLDRETILHTTFFPLSRPKGARAWAYGDSEGSVRLLLDTDLSRDNETADPQITRFGESTYPKYSVSLKWSRDYIKGADDSITTATVLPSFMRFYAPRIPGSSAYTLNPYGNDSEYVPFANWEFLVGVLSHDGPNPYTTQLTHWAQVSGPTLLGAAGLDVTGGGGIAEKYVPLGPLKHRSSMLLDGLQLEEGYLPANTFRYEVEKNIIVLNLNHVKKGGKYRVFYALKLGGGTYDDQFLWNYIADPLAPASADSGIVLETTDLPAQSLVRHCDEQYDEDRYEQHQNGTVTDLYTALTWQRCPANFSLNDNATPNLVDDDSCVADVGTETNSGWQTALQMASNSTQSGHSDWRLPNVKELETLVASCFSPAIEPIVFPDTPIDRGFWSSTSGRFLWQQYINPAEIAVDVWQVEFANGDLQTSDKAALAYTRLVRDSGELPIAPLPAISAGRAAIDEGDTGSSVLEIPVALSRSAAADVTVDYAVTAPNNNAVNGLDFDGTAGTLVFVPGETLKKVPVTVYGNIDATDNKTLYLDVSNNSSNSRIAIPTGVATIFDDDPIVSLGEHRVQEYEGSSARPVAKINVPVLLDRPAAQPITVDYKLLQGTAELGSDVTGLVNGTVTIQTGSKVGYIEINPVNDDVPENDEALTVEISNPVGVKLAPGSGDVIQQRVVLVNDDNAGTYTVLNDTGLASCATDTDNAQTCPQAGLPLQDAEHGRDADPASNDPADGDGGFSLTKLDAAGAALPVSAGAWSCVNDNVTGLIWEVKSDNISSPIANNDLHSSRWTYSWYNSSGVNDGGYAGVQNGGVCIDTQNCDTEKFVAAVNAEALCGFTDWRLPTIDELYTIVDMTGDFSAQIQFARGAGGTTRYFPNPQLDVSSGPWSSSTAAGRDGGVNAWYLAENGMAKKDKGELRTTPLPVRLVRGGIIAPR